MQPDVWQTFSVLSAQYLIVQDLFAPTDNPGKEPLLHSPSTYQHSTRAFTPLAIHSPTQYRSLCSTHHSLNNTRAFAPLTIHSTTQCKSLCSIHSTTQYKSLYSTQQHITGPFAPLNNTLQDPLLHSPFAQQHRTGYRYSAGAFAPLTIHSTT